MTHDTVWDDPDFVATWNNTYGLDMARAGARVNCLFPLFAERVGDFKNKTLVDLGCGNGNLLLTFQSQDFSHWTGIDGGSVVLESAAQSVQDTRVDFIHGDVCSTMPSELLESADIVTSFFVMEEIPLEKTQEHFEAIKSLLNKDGKALVFCNHPHYAMYQDWQSLSTGQPNKKFEGHAGYFDQTPTTFSLGKMNNRDGHEGKASYHHKTLAEIMNAAVNAGLRVNRVLEIPNTDVNWPPQENKMPQSGEYGRFLFLELTK